MAQVTQLAADRATELQTLSILDSTTATANNIVYVSCSIEDKGPLPAQLVRLWVKDATSSLVGNSATSIILQPGSITKCFNAVNIAGVAGSDQFTFWFVTARGNTISASPSANQIVETSSGGIIDDAVSNYSWTTTMKLSLTTTHPNDLLYMAAEFDCSAVASTPISTPSLNWVMRGLSASKTTSGVKGLLETWYAIMPSSGAITITDKVSYDDCYWAADAFAISGIDVSSPFDGNSQIALSTAGSTTPSVLKTTTCGNDLVIGSVEIGEQNPIVTPGVGFTQLLPVQGELGKAPEGAGRSVWSEYYNPSTPENNLLVNSVLDGSYPWAIIADAIKLGGALISLSAKSGPAGQTVAVSGSGFVANSPLAATFNGAPVTLSGFTTTDASGNIPPGATFTVPADAQPGENTFAIVDTDFHSVNTTFTVIAPSITVTPSSGKVGTMVTITGSNFISNSSLRISFDGTPLTTNPSQLTADDAGGFSATFSVPSDTTGSKAVLATDQVNFASDNFAVTPSINITPTEGLNNTSVTVSGQGFAGDSKITVKFAGETVSTSPQNVATGSTGSFSTVTFIAQSSIGSKTVSVNDASGNSGSATFNLVSLDRFTITVPASETAGSSFGGVAVTAYDASGNVINGYTGEVYFTSSDNKATLPYTSSNVYSFTQADNGTHVFAGFTLYTAGSQTITVTCGTISNPSGAITVRPAIASTLIVSGFPNPDLASVASSITVTAKDQYGNTANGYRGTVHFTSSDAAAVLPSDYTFQSSDNGVHTFSKSITLNTLGTQSITATDTLSAAITGSQINIIVDPSWGTPTVSASSATAEQGQTIILTSNAISEGTSPYSYQWLQKAPGASSFSAIKGATETSYLFSTSTSTTTGSWRFMLQVMDNYGGNINSTDITVEVTSAPAVSVSTTSWTMDVGQSETFSATAVSGSGHYRSYQWFENGSVLSGAISPSFSFVPASAGSYAITVTVTDSLGVTSPQSAPATVGVCAGPTLSITPAGPLTMDAGQVQMLSAICTGGSGSLSYQWYLDGVAVGANSTVYYYYAKVTSHSISCQVTDSASIPVTSVSNAVYITVNSPLVAPVLSVDDVTVDQGQTSTLTSTAITSGSSPYTYQWFSKFDDGSYTPISGATSSSYNFVTSGLTRVGVWSFELQVADSAGVSVTATSNEVAVTVNAAPSVSITPVSWWMDVGQSETFTATPSGGSGMYSYYQWYVDGLAQAGQTSSTFNFSASAAGSPMIAVTVTDSLGATSPQSLAPSVEVSASPVVSITPIGPLTMYSGQQVNFTAAASGGSGMINYQWYDGSTAVGTDSSSYLFTAAGASTNITCTVTDSASVPVTSPASNEVLVN